jgi:hypothetical protein
MFARFSKRRRTPILIVVGLIDVIVYCDECIDDPGLIPGMIAAYGDHSFLGQDGATSQSSRTIMGHLREYAAVPPNWPSGSPNFNSIEYLWGIIRWRVGDSELQGVQVIS